ncbi:ribosome production factor 2 homolog isoform X1 [Panulirus ornatus]|uniref:ribosome production factor 2 homolog isoform X1 n=1 Tax=Panulirus ornatus TaxID=150431 RepID=UPI003A86D5FA
MTYGSSEDQKPRNHKSRRALERREPKIIENSKQCLFIFGQKTSEAVRQCSKDIYSFKKHEARLLQRRNPILPFDDILPVERLSQKHDASLFCLATHSKKRPNNIILGRMFDHHLLDMVELGIENYKGLNEFKNAKISSGTKPCLVFCGTDFEDVAEYRRLKNLLIDFFRGVEATEIRLHGFEHAFQFTAFEGKILIRSYRILLKKSDTRIPRVELEEIGPSMALQLRRNRFASEDLMKRACKQLKPPQANRVKNKSKDVFGTKLGRVHMKKQDYRKLQTRKMKGLKKTSHGKKLNPKNSSGDDAFTPEPVAIDQ